MHTVNAVVLGVAGFLLTLLVRAITVNRCIRSKLRLSLVLFAVHAALSLALAESWLTAAFAAQVRPLNDLTVALAIINFLVVVAINPLRADRMPEHFPNIVQDTIIIGLFLLLATLAMQEKFLTTSAVGAVVIGFALQDTLGNMFAGLAIQIEKPFRVGHWIAVANFEGVVTEITWRATKLRTKTGNFVILPNNAIAKEAIVNFSEPALPTRLQLEVGVSYQVPPNDVKAVIRRALVEVPLIAKAPPPEVLLVEFGSSAAVYRARFWITDYAADEIARDQVRIAIYYSLHRANMEIPYPIQVEYQRDEAPGRPADRARQLEAVLGRIDMLAPLSVTDRADLLAQSADRLYGAGEVIVRQGATGDSMFVVCSGRVRVTLEPSGQEVNTIEPGGYFGEMSLLTGDPRTATVSAITDCQLLEITADTFRQLALVHPAVVEQITLAVAERREGLERSRLAAATPTAAADVARRGFLARVQQFLGLPGAAR
jgi:small-conductance mechanosensitive channel/CRP-like cAMP-binding protein